MNVEVYVFDPNKDREISFGAYQFQHVGCGEMASKYVLAHDEYTLTCQCGLEIHLPRFGSGVAAITDSVIDLQPRDLEPDSFHSNLANSIRVRPHGTA
jgi:hypothetical protein